jgi:3-hydroxyacyl-CoA dehydrogenase
MAYNSNVRFSDRVHSRCGAFPASVNDPDKEDSLSNFIVRKAAVLGAGVMGAQIAAHCANADVPVILFDLPAKEGDRQRHRQQGASRGIKKLDPAPLAAKDRAQYIDAANYGSDLARLGECDLVIEAIAEKMEWKLDLYAKVAPHLKAARSSPPTPRVCRSRRSPPGMPEDRCSPASAASTSSTRRATCRWWN